MAIFSGIWGQGVTRDGSYLNPSQDWTRTLWLQATIPPLMLAGATVEGFEPYQTAWFYGDAAYDVPWLWVGTIWNGPGPTDLIICYQFDAGYGQQGSALIQWDQAAWHFLTLRYSASARQIDFLIDAAIVTSGPLNATAFTPSATEYLMTDISTPPPTSQPNLAVAYEGVWQAFLSDAQIAAQMASASPIIPALAFAPLATANDLNDISGNGRNWTALAGSPTTQFCLNITCPATDCLPVLD